jgi:hypothetical protein
MKYIKLFESFLGENYNSLNEDFNSQKIKFINQGYDEKIVNRYIEDFKELRNKKFKEAKDANIEGLRVPAGESRFNIDNYQTFKELELIVDYVAGQRNFGSANFENIEVNGDPIYKNSDIEIYYADSPRACIRYKGNKPYGWCVARNTGNMFYNYRLSPLEPSFYFIKRIKATEKEFSFWNLGKTVFSGEFRDKWHFFVLQVLNNSSKKKYIITSAMNDGDKRVSWEKILEIAPELKGKESLFVSKPLSPNEREKIKKYKGGISDEEFIKLPFKEKKYYLSIYVNMDNKLNDFQFNNLPEELKNDYISYGVGLSDAQFNSIKSEPKLIKRYIDITNRKYETYKKEEEDIIFTKSELKIIYQNFIENKTGNYELKKLLFSNKDFFNEFSESDILALFLIAEKIESPQKKLLSILYHIKSFKKIRTFIDEILKSQDFETIKTLLNYTTQELNNRTLSDDHKEYLKSVRDEIYDKIESLIYSMDPEKLDYHIINNFIESSDNKERVIRKLLTPEIVKKCGWLAFINHAGKNHETANSLVVDLMVSNKEIVDLLKPSDLRGLTGYSLEPKRIIKEILEIRPELASEFN